MDRTIIKNLLMSKLNSHAFQVPFSLSDAPQNSLFVQAMTSQVPLGLRDVVGAEEMLRMSQVVMGIDLKSVSLTERVRRAIEEERELRRPPTEEE